MDNERKKRPDKEFLYKNSPFYKYVFDMTGINPDEPSDYRDMFFDRDGYIHDALLDDIKASYYGVQRFLQAQDHHDTYSKALAEIRNGKKETHWMWYVFPQLRWLGHSKTSDYYGLRGREEAEEYVKNLILKERLIEATQAVLDSPKSAYDIFGRDIVKFRACMKLFSTICDEPIFKKVLKKYMWG